MTSNINNQIIGGVEVRTEIVIEKCRDRIRSRIQHHNPWFFVRGRKVAKWLAATDRPVDKAVAVSAAIDAVDGW